MKIMFDTKIYIFTQKEYYFVHRRYTLFKEMIYSFIYNDSNGMF